MCCHSSSSNAQPYSDNFCRLRSDSVQFENAGEMPWFCPTHSTRSKTEPHVSEISLQMTIDQRFEQVLFIIYHYRFYHNTPLWTSLSGPHLSVFLNEYISVWTSHSTSPCIFIVWTILLYLIQLWLLANRTSLRDLDAEDRDYGSTNRLETNRLEKGNRTTT